MDTLSDKYCQKRWKAMLDIVQDVYVKEKKKNPPTTAYWHYTSSTAALNIFKDYIDSCYYSKYVTKCGIYASNIRFMNDSMEYREGKRIFPTLRHPKSNAPDVFKDNIYIISFCGEGDLLSQWQGYGKKSGVSFCFNLDNTKYNTLNYYDISQAPNKVPEKVKECYSSNKPLRVRYTHDEKTKLLTLIKGNSHITTSKAYDLIEPAFIPYCKNEGFSKEYESRLVFYVTNLVKTAKRFPQFNVVYNTGDETRVKPALNVKFSLINPTIAGKNTNLISKVIIGPGYNQEEVFNLFVHVFDRRNYHYHQSLHADASDKQTSSSNKGNPASPQSKKQTLKWKDFINATPTYETELVKCEDNVERESYLCENGIVIMKSALPFRG